VYFCSPCDHGQIYCSPECGDLQRSVARRLSKQRYWQSFDGRWATARRMRDLRAARRQIVTDIGRQEVALTATVSECPAALPIEGTPAVREETTDEQSIDGDFTGPEGHARDRDGGLRLELPRSGGRSDYAAIFSMFSLMNFNSNSIGLT